MSSVRIVSFARKSSRSCVVGERYGNHNLVLQR
jgi:hypothetical protein